MTTDELEGLAKAILDANPYMTLATADENGRPWVSPVYYAADRYRELFWVSSPEAKHSKNIAVRADVSLVVFDPQVRIGTAQAVYMTAIADELTGTDLMRGIELFSRRSIEHGGRRWEAGDVLPPSSLRAYRATATEQSILHTTAESASERGDERVSLNL